VIIYNDKNKIFIMEEYHVPVMVNEVVDNLVVNPDGVYVDLTFVSGT
jgi:16S rRNA (cytosine1402-N4)-methyltransferase